uniref:NADH-ubiquinone oxidoreductase chain 5 n=1 Tax=Nemertopsis tetraclitophila TaxID=1417004 RepID=A0A075CJU2_9BILA|nr:NADH dehydrogenase subunit 5 [Nemertopsis tetraclitophila]AGZ63911.1 NADH dehydrogenase subunit 5 [Nemertopsis tetraclitophila]
MFLNKELSISLMFTFFIFFIFLFSFFFFLFFCYSEVIFFVDWEFFSISGVSVEFSFFLDWISLSFFCVVLIISVSVIWFSFYYMEGDVYVVRFTWLVIFFVLSMVFFIFIPNLISLLVGWDGLGLISFCLIIYYQNFKSYVSGFITVLMNRFGDVMVLLSIGWLFSFGEWSWVFLNNFWFSFWVSLCLVLAGMTKSAQYPFCSWLPAAMAAPTPVSALVHSSTLVTAGVFLIIRFWCLISSSCYVHFYLQFICLLTMVLAGFSALFEMDLKKIIALSTLSQLSVMLFAVSFDFLFLGLFHLYTHALFKALLFLCAGCIIHSFSHVQDIRCLGSCWSMMPCTMIFFNVASLCLCGFPFLSGFFSKDLILESMLWSNWNVFFFFFLFLGTIFTLGYSFRLILFCFWGVMKFNSMIEKTEEKVSFLFPVLFLGLGSLYSGYLFLIFVFDDKLLFFFPSVYDKFLIFFIFLVGLTLGWFFFFFSLSFLSKNKYYFLLNFFGSKMWFLQLVCSQGVLYFFFFNSFFNLYYLDRGYLELLGGQGSSSLFIRFGLILEIVSKKSVLMSCFFLFLVLLFLIV